MFSSDPEVVNGVLIPNLLWNVMVTLFLCPVLWSKAWHVSKGGLYKWRLTAGSVWLTFFEWSPLPIIKCFNTR